MGRTTRVDVLVAGWIGCDPCLGFDRPLRAVFSVEESFPLDRMVLDGPDLDAM